MESENSRKNLTSKVMEAQNALSLQHGRKLYGTFYLFTIQSEKDFLEGFIEVFS